MSKFSEEEIRRFLDLLGFDNDFADRSDIIKYWMNKDTAWWAIIGPEGFYGGATYGDWLDGIELGSFGHPGNKISGKFYCDTVRGTFIFAGIDGKGNMVNSLMDFYFRANDIVWSRENSSGDRKYLAGTQYAARGGSIEWLEGVKAVGAGAGAFTAGVSGIAWLAVPSPDPLTKGLALASFAGCGFGVIRSNEHRGRFLRSVNAYQRANNP